MCGAYGEDDKVRSSLSSVPVILLFTHPLIFDPY